MSPLHAPTPKPPQFVDDQIVSDELVGRLLRAGAGAVFELLDRFSPPERANLAMFCYHKAHLHQVGRAIAATCDEDTLIMAWGTTLGSAIFQQSRERIDEVRSVTPQRAKITLAKCLPFDAKAFVMLNGEVEDIDEPVVEFAA
jgi:hypothetical protein